MLHLNLADSPYTPYNWVHLTTEITLLISVLLTEFNSKPVKSKFKQHHNHNDFLERLSNNQQNWQSDSTVLKNSCTILSIQDMRIINPFS